jgi:hypothetical protein
MIEDDGKEVSGIAWLFEDSKEYQYVEKVPGYALLW